MNQTTRAGADSSAGRRRPFSLLIGVGFVSLGLVLLVGVGLYQAYNVHARSQLEELNFTVDGPAVGPQPARADVAFLEGAQQAFGKLAAFRPSPDDSSLDNSSAISQPPPAEADRLPSPVLAYAAAYPGVQMHPKYWGQPLWAGTDLLLDESLPDGYRPLLASDVKTSIETTGQARRIRISTIGVDAEVSELRILDLGDSRAYETPNNVVGHIPETSNPGESGNSWFFGHLESPLKGEGSVFRRLPEISKHIKNGDTVYVGIDNDDTGYLYRVTAGRVIHRDDLRIYDSEDATITLVTCVPRLDYSHRFLVTAELVAIRN